MEIGRLPLLISSASKAAGSRARGTPLCTDCSTATSNSWSGSLWALDGRGAGLLRRRNVASRSTANALAHVVAVRMEERCCTASMRFCMSTCCFPRRHRDVPWWPGTIPARRREFVASAVDRWRRSPRPVLHCPDGGLTAWFIPHCFSNSGGRAEQVRLDGSNTQFQDCRDFRQRQFFGKSQKKDSPLLL